MLSKESTATDARPLCCATNQFVLSEDTHGSYNLHSLRRHACFEVGKSSFACCSFCKLVLLFIYVAHRNSRGSVFYGRNTSFIYVIVSAATSSLSSSSSGLRVYAVLFQALRYFNALLTHKSRSIIFSIVLVFQDQRIYLSLHLSVCNLQPSLLKHYCNSLVIVY